MSMSSVIQQLTRPIRSQWHHRAESEVLLECKKRIFISWGHQLSAYGESSLFRYSLSRQCLRQKFWQGFKSNCNEKLILLGEILTKQCNFYASQRLRRMSQIWNLYTRLYTERSFNQIVSKFARELRRKQKRPIAVLLGVAFFSWEKEKISDEEIESCVGELDRLHGTNQNVSQLPELCGCELMEKLCDDGWEAVIKKENLQVWRKAFPNSYLYEYKVLGSFFDIPARAFFSIQTDIEYRKKWDKLVIKLDVIDKEDGGCEVVHWVMHYPYPMYSRDYVYIRRAVVNTHNNTMVLVSRATDHPSCPASKKYVRVTKYSSRMVIRPHRSFDENGFDYVLTYFDDPQAAFPAPAYNWMASSGVPDFVEKLHNAAQDLHFQSWWNETTLPQAKSHNQPCPSGDMEYICV